MKNNFDLISEIDVIILAAGLSKRFGNQNKLLVNINNKPLITNVVDNISYIYPNTINIVIGFEKNKIKNALENKNVRFIVNSNYFNGQSTSIIKAIESLKKSSSAAMICLADMPYISPNEYFEILLSHIKFGGPKKITLPFNKVRGNPVVLGKYFYKFIKNLNGDSGAKEIIEKFKKNIIKVNLESKNCFSDINTQNDFKHI